MRFTMAESCTFDKICTGSRKGYVQNIKVHLTEDSKIWDANPNNLSHEDVAILRMLLMHRLHRNPRIASNASKFLNRRNDILFTHTLIKLLKIMSQWHTEECVAQGISLEIVADCDSYLRRMGKRILRLVDSNEASFSDYLPCQRIIRPAAQWRHLMEASTLNFFVALSLRGDTLPKANIVTKLSIRRTSIHNFDIASLTDIVRTFPRLRTVVFELQKLYAPSLRKAAYDALVQNLPRWNKFLKSVCILESECTGMQTWRHPAGPHCSELGNSLKRFSIHLQKLAFSYPTEISSFWSIHTCWKRLETLLMRASRGITCRDIETISESIVRMPKLKRLVVYYVSPSESMLFTRHTMDRQIQINYTTDGAVIKKSKFERALQPLIYASRYPVHSHLQHTTTDHAQLAIIEVLQQDFSAFGA